MMNFTNTENEITHNEKNDINYQLMYYIESRKRNTINKETTQTSDTIVVTGNVVGLLCSNISWAFIGLFKFIYTTKRKILVCLFLFYFKFILPTTFLFENAVVVC
ncbi:hypothetical protein S83_064226 [Arachis hypogaea]